MKFKLLFIGLLIISSCATTKSNKDIEGVYEIEGAGKGAFWDGGIIDYHLDLPFNTPNRITN